MQDWKSPSVNLSQISPDTQEVSASSAFEMARSTFTEKCKLKTWNGIQVNHILSDHTFKTPWEASEILAR